MAKIPPATRPHALTAVELQRQRALRQEHDAYDPEKTYGENGRALYAASLERQKRKRADRMERLLNDVFPQLEPGELEWRDDHPTLRGMPLTTIEEELVAFAPAPQEADDTLALVELCSVCGMDARQWRFSSLEGYGWALEQRDELDPFVCERCAAA